MDKRYEVYALADRHFYETPDRLARGGQEASQGAAAHLYETARRPVPEAETARIGDWLTMTPPGPDGEPLQGPAQGWEIDASATRANAEKIAGIVWDYCVERRVPFKFVPGPHLLHLRNTKYAPRDGSGKFVTVIRPTRSSCTRCCASWARCWRGSRGRTSSPICAGARARCTSATAPSRARSSWTSGARWCRRCATARGSWCRTGGRRPSRCRSG
ncbi:hypothetical protein SPURM210S_05275 [Streptomyces purpurascens]